MKKYLLLLAGLMILAPNGPADAKAVKLGRGSAYSVAADAKINTGAGAQMDTTKKCDSSCTTCDTTTGKCIGCPTGKRPAGARCVDTCYTVTCADTKFTTVNTGTSCCCETNPDTAPDPITCPANCTACSSSSQCTVCDSGYNLENGQCVKAECESGQLKIGGQCVDCVSGANRDCSTGPYVRISNGTCCKLPTGCAGITNFNFSCTACLEGYYLSGGSCKECPAGTYSNGGTVTSCTTCPTGSTSNAGASSCTICTDGYKYVGGYGCRICSSGYSFVTDINGTNGSCRKTGSLAFGALTSDSTQCQSGWSVPGGNDGIQGSHCGKSGSNVAF